MSKRLVTVFVFAMIGVAFLFAHPELAVTEGLFQSPPPLPPPSNDNWGDATVITELPFRDSVDNRAATMEPEEPFCGLQPDRTVWYRFQPWVDMVIRVNMAGTTAENPFLGIYAVVIPQGGWHDLLELECVTTMGGERILHVSAGVEYYFQLGNGEPEGGGLVLNVAEASPANDDFSDAPAIAALPFHGSVDTTYATLEIDEPSPSCSSGQFGNSAWYAFSPFTSGSITAQASSARFSTTLAVYTGQSLTTLSGIGCSLLGELLTLHVDPGVTYYFQVGGMLGEGGPLDFDLYVTPAPEAAFWHHPWDPTMFDTLQFYDNSWDPGGLGIQSFAWDFGDGGTATGCCPTHRYARDGDYTVTLTVTTGDGRTGSTSEVVQVKTHDVAIKRLAVPNSASSGQTKQITVELNSNRYLEDVQVELYESIPGGYQLVGTLQQQVPVRSANRTTKFSFSYTFTSADGAIGKVTFRAVATILGARDALPADNEAISAPVKVR